MDIGSKILNQFALLGITFLSAVIVIVIHEFAHAFTSYNMGDKLPKFNRKLTLSPIPHIDIVGIIFMMATGFGWGNHVETSPKYYKDKQRGTILVGLSGPLVSLGLGILTMIPLAIIEQKSIAGTLHLSVIESDYLGYFLKYISLYSFNLAFISFIPMNPFDGFAIWGKLIKPKSQFAILQYQSIMFTVFLMVVLIAPIFLQTVISPIMYIFKWSISNIVSLIL